MNRAIALLAVAVVALAIAVLLLAGSIVATAPPRPTPRCVVGGAEGLPRIVVPIPPGETCPPEL